MAFAAEAAACGMRLAGDASQASGTSSSFFGRTLAGFPRTTPARVTASAARVTASAAAAGQAVQEKPKAAEASPSVKLATGLLDGKDPAWKLGTADKARLKAYYEAAVIPAMKAEFGYSNPLEVPQIEKVVVNCGLGDASQSAKALEAASKDIALVTGQRPVVTRSRKAIAGFKLREGVPVGMAATLRGQVMYSYLDRLLNLALPRVRDFRGVSKGGFDGRGNYSMGLAEQTMYPEIQFDQIDQTRGMDISIVTTAKTDQEAQRLLELMGMPFKEGPAPVKDTSAKGRGGARGGGKGGKQQSKPKKKK